MSDGQLLAVVTTSALELGIDIGSLDVCILVGYPGTVISTMQRGGRVGRAGQESAVLLVAGEDALDQYFIHQPEAFFGREPERAVINPDNDVIVKRHLECAAAELPLPSDDPWLRGPGAQAALRELEREGLLLKSADGREWVAAASACSGMWICGAAARRAPLWTPRAGPSAAWTGIRRTRRRTPARSICIGGRRMWSKALIWRSGLSAARCRSSG